MYKTILNKKDSIYKYKKKISNKFICNDLYIQSRFLTYFLSKLKLVLIWYTNTTYFFCSLFITLLYKMYIIYLN